MAKGVYVGVVGETAGKAHKVTKMYIGVQSSSQEMAAVSTVPGMFSVAERQKIGTACKTFGTEDRSTEHEIIHFIPTSSAHTSLSFNDWWTGTDPSTEKAYVRTYPCFIFQNRYTAIEVTGSTAEISTLAQTARKIKKAYIGVDGTAHLVFEAEAAGYAPVFADNSWESIIQACQQNAVPGTWQVGDQKAMTIGGTSYLIDIIGKNHDTYSNGSGTAPLTLQLHSCCGTDAAMLEDADTAYPWIDSYMRETVLPGILSQMPQAVRAGIASVNKATRYAVTQEDPGENTEDLFLLAAEEVFPEVETPYGEGTQYAYYQTEENAAKDKAWWLRSLAAEDGEFCAVSEDGYYTTSGGADLLGVAPAFCF